MYMCVTTETLNGGGGGTTFRVIACLEKHSDQQISPEVSCHAKLLKSCCLFHFMNFDSYEKHVKHT